MTDDDLRSLRGLLQELEELTAQEALARLQRFHQEPPVQVKVDSEGWVLAQEIFYREAELSLESGDLQRCVQALRECNWREADLLEIQAVRSSLEGTEFSPQCQVSWLEGGGFEVLERGEGCVIMGRLSSQLQVEMSTGPIPMEAHQQLLDLRYVSHAYPSDSTRARIGEIFARSAVKLHAGGRSEAALGLLEVALAEGWEHRAIAPSRQALLDKGFQADPTIGEWCRLYREASSSRRSKPRLSLEQFSQRRSEELQAVLSSMETLSVTEKFKALLAISQGRVRTWAYDPKLFSPYVVEAARALATAPSSRLIHRRAAVTWLSEHDGDFHLWQQAYEGQLPPGDLPLPSTREEFEAEFGPMAPWFAKPDQDIVLRVNSARQENEGEGVPFLRGSLTTWGWLKEGEEAEGDWAARAEAWRLALDFQTIAEDGGLLCLLKGSRRGLPYAPFVARISGANGLKGLKAVLGLPAKEALEEAKPFMKGRYLKQLKAERGHSPGPAEQLAYDLFFDKDLVDDGEYLGEPDDDALFQIAERMSTALTDCRQYYFRDVPRYAISPIFLVGRTSSDYLAGLWSYTVRT